MHRLYAWPDLCYQEPHCCGIRYSIQRPHEGESAADNAIRFDRFVGFHVEPRRHNVDTRRIAEGRQLLTIGCRANRDGGSY
jgi:hypothetical protein